jgi:putative YhbY family RNA-binding protein
MAELMLTPKERQALKGEAHALDPVVLLGAGGLTDAVMREIDRALAAHELVKVRVPRDDRSEREAMFEQVADTLSAARVQAIGKLLVFFRPRPEEPAADAPARQTARTAKTARPAKTAPAGQPARSPARPRSAPPLPKKAAGNRVGKSGGGKSAAARAKPERREIRQERSQAPRRGGSKAAPTRASRSGRR